MLIAVAKGRAGRGTVFGALERLHQRRPIEMLFFEPADDTGLLAADWARRRGVPAQERAGNRTVDLELTVLVG